MRSEEWNRILAGLALTGPIAIVAHAQTYMTEQQAAAALFPGVKLEPRWMDLTADEIKAIERASHGRVSSPHLRVYWGPQKEALMVDKVMGKHDFITYAVAIDSAGGVKGVEILDYRETYGYQVRNKSWRDHFVGKSSHDPLHLGKDIPNISGATLSSKHVTDGVRRLLQTYEILRAKA